MPINFLAYGKNQMAHASFERGTSQPQVVRFAVAPHWLGLHEKWRYIKLIACIGDPVLLADQAASIDVSFIKWS